MKKKANQLSDINQDNEINVKVTNSDYFINDQIDALSVTPVINGIIEANADLSMYVLTEGEELAPIRIFINSEGGVLTDAFSLISVMKASIIPIITISLGDCSSSALMIAMAGDKRYVSKYCGILSHQYSMSMGSSKHVDIVARVRDIDLTAQRIISHYVEHSKLTEEEVNDKLLRTHDVYLTAAEGIEYGLFDDYFENFNTIVNITTEPAGTETEVTVDMLLTE